MNERVGPPPVLVALRRRIGRASQGVAMIDRADEPSPGDALLEPRALEFLQQSNAIEDIHCFDYARSRSGQLHGHVAAFLHSQQLARSRRVMSALDLCYWQQLIVLEQRLARIEVPLQGIGCFRSGYAPFNVGVDSYVPPSFARVPELMQGWMRDLRTLLVDGGTALAELPLADLCGEMLQRFEAIHPFVDGNGRVGRLLVNYLLTYWGHRIVVFRAVERDVFFEAHRSQSAMRRFMRRKVVE